MFTREGRSALMETSTAEAIVSEALAADTSAETTVAETTAADTTASGSAMPLGSALITGIIAMVLIYLLTTFLPKMAAAVDKAWDSISGKKKKNIPDDKAEPSPARVEDNYKVYDIYEGEMNLDDYKDDEKENPNGKG